MIDYYYADVLADGRVRACFTYQGPEVGPLQPLWEWQAEGAVVQLEAPINWAGPTESAVLHMVDGAFSWVETAPLVDVIARAIGQIDAAADAARLAVSPAGRDVEYQLAEAQAQAYKDAAYTGPVPPCVDSWARAKQWTPRNAAMDILATAARWYPAVEVIRDLRLNAKEGVRRVTGSGDEITAIVTQFLTDLSTLMKGLQ